MTLVLGALSLTKVKSLRIIKEVRYPRHNIVGKSTGTIDDVAYVVKPDIFELICDVTDADRVTLHDSYMNTMKSLTDTAGSLEETVHVEKVDCKWIIGRDYSNSGPSPECWRCTVSLVLSNA